MLRRVQSQTFIRKVFVSGKLSQYHGPIRREFGAAFVYSLKNQATPSKSLCKKTPELVYNQKRCFWGVDVAFNRVDEERVRLAGPDRAAAEWVLRNGGTIKWTTSSNQLTDYNLLPSTQFESYKLEEIDLTATDVIGIGFEHLRDLCHLKKMKLHGCRTVGDDGLSHLPFVADTLTSLEISSCPMITEKGLNHILSLKKLKTLVLYDLMEIRNLASVAANLRQKMPNVVVKTEDRWLAQQSEEQQ